MIPTIPLALLANLLHGLIFAWAARLPFRDGRNPWGDEVRAVASFELLVRWPLVTYFFLVHREWSFLYLIRYEHLPGTLLLLFLPLDAAALAAGYYGGWSLLRRRARGLLQLVIGGVSVALALFVVALRDRILHDGEAATVDQAPHLLIDLRLLAILLVALGGSTVAAVFVYRMLAATGGRRKVSGARGAL